MSPGLFGGLSVVVLLAVMALGVPIAVAMAAVGFAGFAILVTPEAAYQVLAKDIFSVFNSYTMGMLVMFVLMGYLAYHSGIGKQLYAFAHKTLGYLPGGVAMEQSISALFMAGIIPGIMLTALYMVAVYVSVKVWPHLAPPTPEERPKFGEIVHTLKGGLIETMLIFALSLGGLFAGWFTPTEAGAVGASGVFLIGVLERRLGLKEIRAALSDTTKTSAMILFLLAGATIYGRLVAVSRLPFELAEFLTSLAVPAFVIMGLILLIHLVLGMFIDAMAMILLTIPIFYPLAVDTLGYDPIWFGVMIVYVAAMGVITPPVGINVYVVHGVAEGVSVQRIFSGIWPFLIAIVIASALLMIFPEIATFLPNAVE